MALTKEQWDLLHDPARLQALTQDELRELYRQHWRAQPRYIRCWNTAQLWLQSCIPAYLLCAVSWVRRHKGALSPE